MFDILELTGLTGLAGTWEIVWNHVDKRVEKRVGKRHRIIIFPKGYFKVINPYASKRMLLVKSSTAAFPASAGWYHYIIGNGLIFIVLNDEGNIEIHYFDTSPEAQCNRKYKNMSNYCVGGIGTRRNESSSSKGTHFYNHHKQEIY